MIFNTVILYAKDSKNKLRFWSIESSDNFMIKIQYGQVGGEIQTAYEEIEYGKGGRDEYEQVLSRINSRIKNKIDSGYVYDKQIALECKRVNPLGLDKPMLARKYGGELNYNSIIYGQYKYNGHRCLIKNDDGEFIAYSRKGLRITTIDKIFDSLPGLFPGETIDGELYCHGESFQTISSWVKRKQPNTDKIIFHAYDLITPYPLPYTERLRRLYRAVSGPRATVAPTARLSSPSEAEKALGEALGKGFEGLILRLDGIPYETGKRSKGLLKYKLFLDDEFLVVGVESSKDGWAVLQCASKNGKTFGVVSPGKMHEKIEILNNKDNYIGKQVNVSYLELTKDGIPFHPVANYFVHKNTI